MSNNLDLIEIARKHKLTPEEQDAQVLSFAFGNTHMENEAITKEQINKTMDSLRSEREFTICP